MKLALAILAFAASAMAAPIAVPDAAPEADAAPDAQGTYATYGKCDSFYLLLKVMQHHVYACTLDDDDLTLARNIRCPSRKPASSSWRLRLVWQLPTTRRWLWVVWHLQEGLEGWRGKVKGQ
jgi:hypothetical protein